MMVFKDKLVFLWITKASVNIIKMNAEPGKTPKSSPKIFNLQIGNTLKKLFQSHLILKGIYRFSVGRGLSKKLFKISIAI
jgi:hypothetical protein